MIDYTELYKTYRPKLLVLFSKQLSDKDTAEDLTQDTLLRVYNKLDMFDSKRSKLSTWIYTIAFNVLKNHFRSLSRSPQLIGVKELYDNEYTETFDSPENILISAELEDAHNKIMSNMPEKYLEAYVLKEVENLSYQEICRKLRIKEGTVKSRISRAKTFIEKEVKKEV